MGEVGHQLTVLVVDLGAHRQLQLDRRSVGAVLVATEPGLAAAGLDLVPRAQLGEIAQFRIGDQDDVAAVAAVAAVRSASGYVLLAPEGKAAVPTAPGQHENARVIVEWRLARPALVVVTAWSHELEPIPLGKTAQGQSKVDVQNVAGVDRVRSGDATLGSSSGDGGASDGCEIVARG